MGQKAIIRFRRESPLSSAYRNISPLFADLSCTTHV